MKPEDKKDVVPAGDSPAKTTTEEKKSPIEGGEGSPEDTDFDKDLEALESGDEPAPAPKPKKSELEKAVATGKSIAKRIKALGGDPTEVISDVEIDEPTKPAKADVDTSQFITKLDFARQEAQKLARSPSELKVIMWWVENKGMSVEDAHLLANKGRIKKIVGEVSRANAAVPSNGAGGAGQRPEDKTDAPTLPDADRRRLEASGMKYDPAKKAYVGKKVQHRYDEKSKNWVTEKI
jgi:hypothetical protein